MSTDAKRFCVTYYDVNRMRKRKIEEKLFSTREEADAAAASFNAQNTNLEPDDDEYEVAEVTVLRLPPDKDPNDPRFGIPSR